MLWPTSSSERQVIGKTMLVNEFLVDSAREYPEKTALVFGGRRLTYRTIYDQVHNFAGYLVNSGLQCGDRIGIYLGNSPEAVVAIFGALEAGGCSVVINPTTKADKLCHLLNDSGAAFLIAPAETAGMLGQVCARLAKPPETIFVGAPTKKHGSMGDIIEWEVKTSWTPPIDIDLATIIYTSGSTGGPKGVTMTHRNVTAAANSITTYLENVPDDIILNMLPFSFDYGLYQLLMAFKIGGTLILEPGFGYPFQIIELIKNENVTGLPCVPTMFALLLQLKHLERLNLTSVRYITNTAAALPPTFIPGLKRLFPNARIYSMYGLTECKRVSYLPPEMIDQKPDSVGIPMPNTEVWIVDKNGRRLPPGEVGELVVRGASVMQGYWNDPAGTAQSIRPGRYPWEKVLYTGDLFRMDQDGFLYFVGRRDDLIKSRGERVSPKEIENVLYALEEVLNARVTGTAHEIHGQAIKAEIVLREGKSLTEKQVKAHCHRHLEDLMVPHIVEFVDELPISPSGKIKRVS